MATKIWICFDYALDGIRYSDDGGVTWTLQAQDASWDGSGYLHGVSENRIIANVGQDTGAGGPYYPIAIWDGNSWTVDTTTTTNRPACVVWASSNEIFLTPVSSAVDRRWQRKAADGTWSIIHTISSGHTWEYCHGYSNSAVFACADYFLTGSHYVKKWDGSSVSEIYTSSETGYAGCVYAVSEDSVWYAWNNDVDYSLIIEHWDGVTWTETYRQIHGVLSQSSPEAFFFLNENTGWLMCDGYQENGGPILYWNGSAWTEQSLPAEVQQFEAFYGIHGSSSSNVYATGLGVDNRLIKYNGSTWSDMTPTSWLSSNDNLSPLGIFVYEESIPVQTTGFIGNQFNISRIDYVTTPIPRNIWNEFDEHAATTSLFRLQGEKNWELKRRTLDNAVNRGGASYQGLVNSITRELGLSQYDAMIINPKLNVDSSSFIAPDPKIEIREKYIYLYSDFEHGLLANQIDRLTDGGNYEHLGKLVEFINTSLYFEAHLSPGIDEYIRSSVLLNQTNIETVDAEDLPCSTKFKLDHFPVVSNSIQFARREAFKTPVASEAQVRLPGDYYIDCFTGIVRCHTLPSFGEYIRYKYIKYPFKVKASPVVVHDLNDDNFKNHIFELVLQDDGTYARGMPTKLGANILNELITVIAHYWGS